MYYPILVASVEYEGFDTLLPNKETTLAILKSLNNRIEKMFENSFEWDYEDKGKDRPNIDQMTLDQYFNDDHCDLDQYWSRDDAEWIDHDVALLTYSTLQALYYDKILPGNLTLRQTINKVKSIANSGEWLPYIKSCAEGYGLQDAYSSPYIEPYCAIIKNSEDIDHEPELDIVSDYVVKFNYKDIIKAKEFADKIGGRLVRLAIEE